MTIQTDDKGLSVPDLTPLDEKDWLDYDDRIEIDDEPCPQCGAVTTLSSPCTAIGCDDGYVDMHEYDDPLWYDEGETEMCHECFGTGRHHWCKGCGFDFQDPRNRRFILVCKLLAGKDRHGRNLVRGRRRKRFKLARLHGRRRLTARGG